MDRKEADSQFLRLKGPCHAFIDSPSLDSIRDLLKSVEKESQIHNLVSEFVLYPIGIYLGRKNTKLSDDIAESTFKVVSSTLVRSGIKQPPSFITLYDTLCYHFDPSCPARKEQPYSEEVRAEILTAFAALIKFAEKSVINQFYLDQKSNHQLGMLVHLLLSELTEQRSSKIRFMALNTLVMLIQPFCDRNEIRISPNKPLFATSRVYESLWSSLVCSEHYPVRDIFKSFFPGISTRLVKFIISDSRPPAGLISAALLAFANFTAFTCDNKFYESSQESIQSHKAEEDSEKSSETWWGKTSVKLTSLFVTATQCCIAHENFKTRFCLLETVSFLLTHCRTSLPNLATPLIDTLIVLCSDRNEQVKKSAVKSISSFSHIHNLTSSESMLKRIDELSCTLPKTVKDLSDASKLPVLRLLLGYLNLVGETQLGRKSSLQARGCVKNLIQVFTRVLRLDLSDNSIIAQIRNFPEFEANKLDTFKVAFTDLGEEAVAVIIEILHAIGHHCEFELILNLLFELSEKENLRKEVIFILNHVFIGNASTQSREYISDTVQSISSLYLQPDWIEDLEKGETVLLENSSLFDDQFSTHINTISSLKHRVLQQILILEGLGFFAVSLKKDFQPFLATIVFPLLEKSNNSNPYVQAQSLDSLRKVCTALELPSISTLIHSNADYIVNVIALQFFQECTSHSALNVLQAVFRNSSAQLLPLLEDSVKYILKSIRFYHTNSESVILLPTLVVISDQLFKWERENAIFSNTLNHDLDTSPDRIVEDYLKYLEFYFPQDEVEDENLRMEDETGEEKPEELQHSLSRDIIESVSYYLNFLTTKITALALNIITNCFLTLSTNRDKSLNLLHRIWPQFVRCAQSSDSIILIAALDTLIRIIPYYGDFLERKVEKDLWSYLTERLGRLVNASKQCSSYYLQTQECKLQLALLQHLPALAESTRVKFANFHQLLAVYHPYLCWSQPKMLRDSAVRGIRILSRLYPDSVYFVFTLVDRDEVEHFQTEEN